MGSYPEVEGDMKEMILVLLNKIVSAVSENVKIALKGPFQRSGFPKIERKFERQFLKRSKAKNKNAPLQVIDESDKKANYLLRFCQPITDTISFIFKYIDPTDEEELINCACSTGEISASNIFLD